MGVIIGRKIGMSQVFGEDGELIPVTVIQAGPCKVLEARTTDKHGYQAIVVGFEELAGAKVRKPLLGMFKKLQSEAFRFVKEFRDHAANPGETITVEQFKKGDEVRIEGTTIGKGWAGVIKKWNFSRGRESHGGNFNRAMGSAGMHTWPARTIPGKKMSGHLGVEKKTLKAVTVVDVIPEDNLLIVKGPCPGVDMAVLKISTTASTKKKAA